MVSDLQSIADTLQLRGTYVSLCPQILVNSLGLCYHLVFSEIPCQEDENTNLQNFNVLFPKDI